jgi:hypothetical protein
MEESIPQFIKDFPLDMKHVIMLVNQCIYTINKGLLHGKYRYLCEGS